MLTEDEHELVRKLGDCMNLFVKICGPGRTREHDLNEFANVIHYAQNSVLAQSAAREYPDLYRLVGETIKRDDDATMPPV